MNRESDLIDHIKRHLDESVEDLDALATAKIAAARATALQEGTRKRLPWRWPAIGLAAAAVAFLALIEHFPFGLASAHGRTTGSAGHYLLRQKSEIF